MGSEERQHDAPKNETKNEVEINIKSIQKHWPLILLGAIVIFGFYLRVYHIDYPVIGYHNWKEVHYLTEARNFARQGFFAHGFFAPELDYPGIDWDPSGVHSDTFPTLPIIIGLIFKFTGPSLFVARLISILFNTATIIFMYFFMKEAMGREDLALVSATLFAIAPLFTFFSHNVDIVNTGIFFMLAGAYYYLHWHRTDKTKDFVLAISFCAIAFLTKYPFGIIALPILFTFPWKKCLDHKKYRIEYAVTGALAATTLGWMYYANEALSRFSAGIKVASGKLIDFGVMSTPNWMAAMKSYIADNYTTIGFYFALAGAALFLFTYFRSTTRTTGKRFLAASIVSAVIFVPLMAQKLGGHSYHQYPIAPFILAMASFAFVIIAQNARRIIKIPYSDVLIIILLMLVVWSPASQARDRQYDTQFIGLDIAGEYIKDRSAPNERIIHSGHQDYGIFWHADRKGLDGGIPDVDKIRYAEENLNVSWIFMYQWGLAEMQNQEKWRYIKDNYRLAQFAFRETPQGPQTFYMLFRKGGMFDEAKINELLEGKPLQSRTYELTTGTIELQYVNIE